MNQTRHEFSDTDRRLLRHFLAAIAYRTQKAVRDAPDEFADFRAAPGVRTPHQLVRHMSDVLGYARTTFQGGTWRARTLSGFSEEIARFHQLLGSLGEDIETADFGRVTPGQLLQGPLADAMTHAGQLAMLRRLSGSPIPPENFIVATIDADNVGTDQPAATSEDADWYDAEDEPW
ncbi:MAG: hypothetical protein E4H28_02700 [Gemmatimonadales bacterium]|nr:MAG: hypothetical protein E4H28_02700 [Gemmatimonadales bacterium]